MTNIDDDLNIQTAPISDNAVNSITVHQIESNDDVETNSILSISKFESSVSVISTNEVTEIMADSQTIIFESTQNYLIASETAEPVVDSENSAAKDDDNVAK